MGPTGPHLSLPSLTLWPYSWAPLRIFPGIFLSILLTLQKSPKLQKSISFHPELRLTPFEFQNLSKIPLYLLTLSFSCFCLGLAVVLCMVYFLVFRTQVGQRIRAGVRRSVRCRGTRQAPLTIYCAYIFKLNILFVKLHALGYTVFGHDSNMDRRTFPVVALLLYRNWWPHSFVTPLHILRWYLKCQSRLPIGHDCSVVREKLGYLYFENPTRCRYG